MAKQPDRAFTSRSNYDGEACSRPELCPCERRGHSVRAIESVSERDGSRVTFAGGVAALEVGARGALGEKSGIEDRHPEVGIKAGPSVVCISRMRASGRPEKAGAS